jgi:type I restriction enzyme S subunit
MPLQEEFAAKSGSAIKLKAAQHSNLTKLDALFASLQHRAFNGERTSKDVERELAIAG